MATEYLTWPQAVEAVCRELEEFAAFRDVGLTVEETAVAIGVPVATAERYERTCCLLLAALTCETAPATPAGAATYPTSTDPSPKEKP